MRVAAVSTGALVCAPVTRAKTPERADPITRLLADRVTQLRERAGITQADFGRKMSELRPGWSRSSVAKFEKYQRESVSVADLFAFALALDVPPVMLLADPREVELVPVDSESEATAWDAFSWLIGAKTLDGHIPLRDDFAVAHWFAHHAVQLGEALRNLDQNARITGTRDPQTGQLTRDPKKVREITAERDRELLTEIRELLYLIKRGDTPVPTLPSWVHDRASELGVDLAGGEV